MQDKERQNRNLILVLGLAALSLCLCCSLVLGTASFISLLGRSDQETQTSEAVRVVTRVVTSTAEPAVATPAAEETAPEERAPAATPEGAAPTAEANASAAPGLAMDPSGAEMPQRDLRALALRLKDSVTEIPEVVNAVPPTYNVGDKADFWVSNNDTQEHNRVTATLRYITPHVYMWVQDGVRVNDKDLAASAERFEKETYPTNREFFGSEWTPGVDNDPHLSVLHALDMGETVAGYYSSADEFSKLVNPYSNEREMFYISAEPGVSAPNTSFYDGTLAHEFQHMIHWANDRNEDSWVNEGMSELAGFLNGFDPGGADVAFSQKPDTQLNTWADPSEGNIEHYGASYLFMSYFLDRFGEDLTKAVVASPRNGIAGFNEALEKAGRTERFDDIFADWVVANYLDRPDAVATGDYGYSAIDPMRPSAETFRRLPADADTQVGQYATDYYEIRRDGDAAINFEGQSEVQLVNADLRGQYSWWSNRGDDSDARLTRAFDLRGVDKATLAFSTWYDIEDGWDYAYLSVSTDGGKTWKLLPGKYTTDKNPVGNAFGAGWTGKSGGSNQPEWVDESVDLSAYAGKEILLRFEYVTDDAVNEAGFLLDDIAIPEIGYRDDAEAGVVEWQPEGWLLTDNKLPQRWLVQLIRATDAGVTVTPLEVGTDGKGQMNADDLARGETVVLAVSGQTQYTTEPASYKFDIQQR